MLTQKQTTDSDDRIKPIEKYDLALQKIAADAPDAVDDVAFNTVSTITIAVVADAVTAAAAGAAVATC